MTDHDFRHHLESVRLFRSTCSEGISGVWQGPGRPPHLWTDKEQKKIFSQVFKIFGNARLTKIKFLAPSLCEVLRISTYMLCIRHDSDSGRAVEMGDGGNGFASLLAPSQQFKLIFQFI